MAGVQNTSAVSQVKRDVHPDGRDGWRTAGCRAGLIDTRLVRAELARLRGPRPGTQVYSARVIRSTIAGRRVMP
jgi:hypothetical protein